MIYSQQYHSPLGEIILYSKEDDLIALFFKDQKHIPVFKEETKREKTKVIAETCYYLDIYFQKEEPKIEIKTKINTTPFRKRVYEILQTIPYGQTLTYQDIAKTIAKEKGLKMMSCQAIGKALSYNPISILIPCHRVIGKDGSLKGYAGGLYRKEKLLGLERK